MEREAEEYEQEMAEYDAMIDELNQEMEQQEEGDMPGEDEGEYNDEEDGPYEDETDGDMDYDEEGDWDNIGDEEGEGGEDYDD